MTPGGKSWATDRYPHARYASPRIPTPGYGARNPTSGHHANNGGG